MKHLILAAALVAVPLAATAQLVVVGTAPDGDRVLIDPETLDIQKVGSDYIYSVNTTVASDYAIRIGSTSSSACNSDGGYLYIRHPQLSSRYYWMWDGTRMYDALGRALCIHGGLKRQYQKTKS